METGTPACETVRGEGVGAICMAQCDAEMRRAPRVAAAERTSVGPGRAKAGRSQRHAETVDKNANVGVANCGDYTLWTNGDDLLTVATDIATTYLMCASGTSVETYTSDLLGDFHAVANVCVSAGALYGMGSREFDRARGCDEHVATNNALCAACIEFISAFSRSSVAAPQANAPIAEATAAAPETAA